MRVRSDFLGYEVDRFFRTTKAAYPQCVTIGQNLAKRLHLDTDKCPLPSVTTGHTTVTADALGAPGVGEVKGDWKVIRTDLTKEQLPGCDEDYTTYHIFSAKDLPKILKESKRDPLKIAQIRELLGRGELTAE